MGDLIQQLIDAIRGLDLLTQIILCFVCIALISLIAAMRGSR
jgi:hypothetical protein